MNKIKKPYVYCITFKLTGQIYIGVRFAKDSHVGDILIDYFTSSKIIHDLIKRFGIDSFSVKILKVFDSIEKAKDYEFKLLVKIKAGKNKKVLNQCSSGSMGDYNRISNINKEKIYYTNGTTTIWLPSNNDNPPEGYYRGKHYVMSEETKKKISDTNKRKNISPKNCKEKRSSEHLNNYKDSMKDAYIKSRTKTWMSKDGNSKRVPPENIELFLKDGWVFGKCHTQSIFKIKWMTNGVIKKKFSENEWEKYLQLGWKFGTKIT